MAEVTIAEVNGEASLVRGETGEQVKITVGMTLAEGDVLNISPDGFVVVSVDGELRTIPAGQSVTFPLQLDFTESNSDDEFAVFDESVDELTVLLDGTEGINIINQEGDADFLDVLAGDGDILESLEATAAGLDGGAGTDGGSNFVRVDRINEEVDPVGFQFDQSANGNDEVAPIEFSGTDDQAQDISLSLDAIGLTNDNTPALSGITSAIPGSTVTLTVTDSEGNTQVVTAIVQDDGTFSVDVQNALADGNFTVDATVLEPTGNTADSSTIGEIDATAPIITINTPGSENDATPTLSGATDAVPGSTVTLTITDNADNTQTVTAIVQADGTYSVDVPAELAEGEFTVNASVTDEAGNTATTDTTGVIDTTAPSITIDTIATGNDTTPTLSGATDAVSGSTVTLTITDSTGNTQTVTAIVQADGTYSVDVPAELAEGEFTVNASVTDEAGNTANAEAQGAIDVTAPTISLNDPGINGDATPTLSGLTDAVPGSTITLTVTDSAGVTQTFTTTVLADGTFTVEIPSAVAEGTYSVTAEVTDGAGNTSQATASGDYDSASPSTTVNQPAPSNDTTPNVSGETNAPPGSEVVIVVTDSEGNEQTIVTTVGADGTFNEVVPAELSEGEYTVDVTVTTPAGNSSTTTVTGEVDTTAPRISLGPIGSTNDDTPVINGDTDAEPGAIVTLEIVHSDGTTQTITATVQEDGSFSTEVPQALANGDFTVTATVSDVAGNTASTIIDAVINTQGPNVVIETGSPTNDSESIGGSSDAPNSEVVIVITDSDGNSQTIISTTDENGNFNVVFPPGAEEGEYNIEVTVTDANGNSSTATATAVLDSTPPVVNIDPQTDTNDSTPTISGNTDLPAGSEVVITVTDSQGNTQTVTAIVDEIGNFSADVEEALAEGNYEVSVEATDAAGNTTTAVDNSGNIDTTAPVLSLDPQTDGSDTTPTISGSSDLPPGSTVTIAVTDSAGNTQTIDAIVDENGDFSVDVQTPLTEGEYTVEASASDDAGNTTTVTEDGGNIDTQTPTISLEPLGTGNDTTPSISGSTNLEAGSTVTLTVTDSAGNSQTFTATVDAKGEFSADVPAELADGDYTVEATATDAAGNSASTSQTGTVDSNAPSLTLDPLGDDNDATPIISGTTDLPAGSSVTLVVTDSLGNQQTIEAFVDENGGFSAEVPSALAEGNYSVTATAVDENGNTASVTENGGIVDTTAPSLSLDPVGSGNDPTPTLSGSTDLPEGSVVSLTVVDSAGNTQTINTLVDANGNFSVDIPQELADGDFTVTATAEDEAGNEVTDNATGNINTNAPTLVLDGQGETNDSTPTISGSTSLPEGNVITLTVTDSTGNTQTITATVGADGSFGADVTTPLADGVYTVTASATDGDGNTTTITDNGGFVDTTAPTLTLENPGSTGDITPTLSGTTDLPEGSTVTLVVTDSAGNTQTINALVDANGGFSVDVPNALADGDFTVSASATDSAGNTANASTAGNVNSQAPLLTLGTQGVTSDVTPTITGTTDVAPGTLVTITVVDANGNSQRFQAVVEADGTFSADVPNALAEGDFTVTATVSDAQGNTATVNETNGSIDTQAPIVAVNPLDSNNDTTPVISGNTDLPEGAVVVITVTDNNGDTQTINALVDADGNFATEVLSPLPEGDYSVEVTATDDAGNSTTVTEDGGNIDTTAPVLKLNQQGIGNDATPTISGTTDIAPSSTVSISVTDNAGNTQTFDATVQANGTFSVGVPVALSEGNYSITATATDVSGNTTTTNENSGIIDTTAPATPTVDAGNGTEITGTAEAGATVNVDVDGDGTPDFTVTADGDGNWSVTPDTPLANGTNVTATATDAAGNVSAPASDTVNAVAPVVTINDVTTNDTTPALTGTVDDAVATVVVTIDGNDYTATNNGDGSWTLADDVVATLSEGSYTATVTATDDAGNVDTDTGTVVIDTSAPATPTVDAGNGTEITGTAEAGATVNVDVDGDGTPDFTVTADSDGNWSVTPATPLVDGVVVTATATDEAGNTSGPASDTVNAVAPVVTINDVTTNDTTPELTGTVDDATATIVVTIDGNNYTATNNGDGTWTLADDVVATLAEGSYTATVTATDTAGNTDTDTGTVVIDTTAPTVAINDLTTNDTTPELTGTVSDPNAVVVVTIDGNDYTATNNGDGTWTLADDVVATLAEGSYTATVTATDTDGNTGTNSGTVVIDTTAPTVAINDLTTNDTTPELTGTVSDPNAVVVVTIDGNDYPATNNGDGTWTLADNAVATLAEGSYTATVTATDDAGNADTDTGT
ncbi:Ig-like domain-containing protein, partial [Alteromonas sp. S015]|uniref:Ig-like domain-containing protein n=1 Tax=Alteromonas sp. S015 TaxID=3117401 RepID=UPI002FE10BE7